MAYIVMAHVFMAYTARASIAMAYEATAYTAMAYVGMAYVVMARLKVLRELAGDSVIGHVLRRLRDGGIERVVLVVGARGRNPREHVCRHAYGGAIFGDCSGHADGERRGLDRIGG